MSLAWTAFRGILRQARHGEIKVSFPSTGEETFRGAEPGPEAHLVLRDPRGVWASLRDGGCGFGEAYMQGWLDSPEPAKLVEYAAVNRNAVAPIIKGKPWTRRMRNIVHRVLRNNSRRGGRRNIAAHYDLGNAFYETWLDPSMTYSSAVFDGGDEALAAAQARKYDRILDDSGLRDGEHLLEIGCGWGGLAEHAARTRDCRVTAITISRAQHDYAQERIQRAGLSDRVDIRLQDYRDLESNAFDRAASIEMFEAVGERHWPTFFDKLRDALKPGGQAALQIITIADDLYDDYRSSADFIQKYIFPGGMLPSTQSLNIRFEAAGLEPLDRAFFGRDYARTLAEWNRRFQAAWPKISDMGFDERFRRMWTFYLAYCEGGFAAGSIDVGRFALRRA